MSKLPWMQFDVADWMQDTRALSCMAKGAWIDILCSMWRSKERGKISLPMIGYARLIGTDEVTAQSIIQELIELGICDTSKECNGNVTLTSRRMARDEREREQTNMRVKRYRNAHVTEDCNASVTEKYAGELDIEKEKERNTLATKGSRGMRAAANVDNSIPFLSKGVRAGNRIDTGLTSIGSILAEVKL